MKSGKEYELTEVGFFMPKQVRINELKTGEVGYFAANIRTIADVKIGDEVVTSSVSDIFPTNIPIGIIISVTQTGHLPFKSAKVKTVHTSV